MVVSNALNTNQTVDLQLLNKKEEKNDYEQGRDECEGAKNTKDSIPIGHSICHMRCTELRLQLGIRDALKRG